MNHSGSGCLRMILGRWAGQILPMSGSRWLPMLPYEMMKLRCLNGSHTALALLGQLHGKQVVSAAIADPLLAGFINSLWTQEIIPSVNVPQGEDNRLL